MFQCKTELSRGSIVSSVLRKASTTFSERQYFLLKKMLLEERRKRVLANSIGQRVEVNQRALIDKILARWDKSVQTAA